MKTLLIMAVATASSLVALSAAAAEMDAKQVTIAAKALGFATPKASAGVKVVVTPGAAPVAAVQSALSTASVAGGDAASAAGAFAVFVASIDEAKKANGKGTITIGNDVACVEAGACVIAVETTPKVTIYVSKAAASAAGVDFDPNFKMMVTEK
jgi:hypothetical protein